MVSTFNVFTANGTHTSTLASGQLEITFSTIIPAPAPKKTETRTEQILQIAVPSGIAVIFVIVIVISVMGTIMKCLADRRAQREWKQKKEALLPTTSKNENMAEVQNFVGTDAVPADAPQQIQAPIPLRPPMNSSPLAGPYRPYTPPANRIQGPTPPRSAMSLGPHSSTASPIAVPYRSYTPPSTRAPPRQHHFPRPPMGARTASNQSLARTASEQSLAGSTTELLRDGSPQIYVSGPKSSEGENERAGFGRNTPTFVPHVTHPDDAGGRRSWEASVHTSSASSENGSGSEGGRVGGARESWARGTESGYYERSGVARTDDAPYGDQVRMVENKGDGGRIEFRPNGGSRR